MSRPNYGSVSDAAQTTGPQNPLWTAQRVRDELPAVDVFFNGKPYHGVVKGRQNDFATVYFEDWYWDWAWQTVADALNKGVPLRA
jgi:hypothetical protein